MLAAYAVQLVFNGGQGFTALDGSHAVSHNENITAFRAGTVISAGVLSPYGPVALSGVWATLSAGLCITYGFRRRWTAILDGHTLFRLGVGLDEQQRLTVLAGASTAEIEDCVALKPVPGMVGDVDSNGVVGKIGLTEGRGEDKGKRYV
jgi:hypothetical protein